MPFAGVLDAGGVHALRRKAKEARAVLRLAEDAGRLHARQARRMLAAAVRPLGALRDAEVAAGVAGKLALKLTDEAQLAARSLADAPSRQRGAAWWADRWRRLEQARSALRRVDAAWLSPRERKAAMKVAADRACRRAHRADRQPANLHCAHEWRKSVQELRFQLAAVYARKTSAMADLETLLHKVGRALGRAMDLTLLLHAIKTHRWPASLRGGVPGVTALACRRRKEDLRRAHKAWPKARRKLDAL